MALKADGRIVSWGNNDGGKTNVPVAVSYVIPMAAGMSHSVAVRADGRVFAWGGNSSGQTNVPAGLNNVIGLGVGPAANHSVALRNEVFSPVAWLDANNTFYGLNTFNAGIQVNGTLRSSGAIVGNTISGNSFSGSGSGLTNLQAQNILFGTLSDARLSANVALLNSSPAFTGQVSADGGMRLNDSDLWLRSSGVANGLGWYGVGKQFAGEDINGPVLFGADGGALGQLDGRGQSVTLRWNSFNRVGILRDAAANRLEVEGNASKTTSGNWLANSDARIKTHVRPVSGALEKLAQVRLVSFRYTDEYRAQHSCIEDREHLNVIAQEFQKVFPDYVKKSGEKLADGGEILQVDTYPLTIYSAAAVQELNRKLEEKLARKDAEIAELKRSVAELKQLVLKTHR